MQRVGRHVRCMLPPGRRSISARVIVGSLAAAGDDGYGGGLQNFKPNSDGELGREGGPIERPGVTCLPARPAAAAIADGRLLASGLVPLPGKAMDIGAARSAAFAVLDSGMLSPWWPPAHGSDPYPMNHFLPRASRQGGVLGLRDHPLPPWGPQGPGRGPWPLGDPIHCRRRVCGRRN